MTYTNDSLEKLKKCQMDNTSTLSWESHEQVLWPNPIKLTMIYHHKGSCIFKTAKQFWSWTWHMTSHVTEHNEHVAQLFKPSEDTFSTNLYQLFVLSRFHIFKKMELQPFCTKSSIYNMSTKPLQNSMAFWIVMLCIIIRQVITFWSNRLPPSL